MIGEFSATSTTLVRTVNPLKSSISGWSDPEHGSPEQDNTMGPTSPVLLLPSSYNINALIKVRWHEVRLGSDTLYRASTKRCVRI